MVKVSSTMVPLGTAAPDFSLANPANDRTVALSDFGDARALLVIFLSNHCPFEKHPADDLAVFAREYAPKGLAVVGINANDVVKHPADSSDQMAKEVDGKRRLAYRGQFDDSRPSLDKPVTGADLRGACDVVLAGGQPPAEQAPSVGCNIKWRPANAPDWFGG